MGVDVEEMVDDTEKPMVDGRPAWMRTLHTSVRTWLDLVPKVPRHLDTIISFPVSSYLLN